MIKTYILRKGILDMQICVPKTYTDREVIEFAESENSCGTQFGWHIRKQGSKFLAGDDERVQCSKISDNCHITLDA